MIRFGTLFMFFGFGSALLSFARIHFTLLAWADPIQPAFGLALGAAGIVLVVVKLATSRSQHEDDPFGQPEYDELEPPGYDQPHGAQQQAQPQQQFFGPPQGGRPAGPPAGQLPPPPPGQFAPPAPAGPPPMGAPAGRPPAPQYAQQHAPQYAPQPAPQYAPQPQQFGPPSPPQGNGQFAAPRFGPGGPQYGPGR